MIISVAASQVLCTVFYFQINSFTAASNFGVSRQSFENLKTDPLKIPV
jgi:hypothetical protein